MFAPNTVARLLDQMGYSPRLNQKQISTCSSSDRHLQFEYLAQLRDRFRRRHLPMISVDTKKRELAGVGNARLAASSITTFAATPAASPSPTASMMSPRIAAPS